MFCSLVEDGELRRRAPGSTVSCWVTNEAMQRTRLTSPGDGPRDPVAEFQHDHGSLNELVRALGALVRKADSDASAGQREHVANALSELREELFLHFAREEEGLFPFVSATLPDLHETVTRMVAAHDGICGTVARMTHIVSIGEGDVTGQLAAIFARFETAYAEHARREYALLDQIGPRLSAEQRAELAELVRGL